MDRLAELRERRALTLRELAEMSGVAADTINQIELGHRKPRPSTLRKLARALEVDVEEFYAEPTLAGKAVASTTGHPRTTAQRALEIADSDSFRREAKGATTEDLQQTVRELAHFVGKQTREDPSSDEEAHRRVMAHERIGIIGGELERRGAPSSVKLVLGPFHDAMTPPEETSQQVREGQEAG
jgi:transcriptional regulator with XRE-family HTH domain